MATIGLVTLAIGNVLSGRIGSLAAASARPTVTTRVSSPTRTKVITPVTVPSDSKSDPVAEDAFHFADRGRGTGRRRRLPGRLAAALPPRQ